VRPQRRIRTLALLAVALVVALVLGREAAENARGVDSGAADAEADAATERPPGPFRGADARVGKPESATAIAESRDAHDLAAEAFESGFDFEPGIPADSDRALRDEEERGESIVLDRFGNDGRFSTIRLAGEDPEAPRDLLAWRVKHGRFAVVARGSSEPDGSLHFPEIVAPRDGIEIAITSADSIPGLPGSSQSRRLPPRDPYAPQATVAAAAAGEVVVRVFPRETTGEVLLADSYGVVFASYPVPNSPLAAHRVIDVALSVTGSNVVVLLAHEFSDGRSSDWNVLQLPMPEAD